MATLTVRLLPYAEADGPHNMAADETLLHSAAAGVASLRFYGWSRPTLSLGYFQPEAVRHINPALAALPWVRRPSGGDALVHHHEVTYALALPPAAAPGPAAAWLCRVHEIIAAALRTLGVATDLQPDDRGPHGPLCFRHFSPGDLIAGRAKVVGSAQRRRRGALLQHGGILLAASPHAPELPGIFEAAGTRLRSPDVCRATLEAIRGESGWEIATSCWTEQEDQTLQHLVATRYARQEWNARR